MKAVIPAAGMGTRMLPATKSMPKEMLPVVDKPVIQYVVEEAVASGCDDILIVTGRGKRAIEDHFDHSMELEHHLRQAGKDDVIQQLQEIADLADIHYVRQKEPLGLGHALLCARKFVGAEPFAVLLGDDIVCGATPATRQLADVHEETKTSSVAALQVSDDEVSRYGIFSLGPGLRAGVTRAASLVEKPSPSEAPSNLAVMGRYVLTPSVFDHLRNTTPGRGGELQLTDALSSLARTEGLLAVEFQGTRLDAGDVLGWISANLEVALSHPSLNGPVRALMETLIARHGRPGS